MRASTAPFVLRRAGFAPRWDAARAVYTGCGVGGEVALTLEAPLQRAAEAVLMQAPGIAGAVVVLEAASGRVLVLAERGAAAAGWGSLALEPFPAASLFKVASAAVALEAGLRPASVIRYRGWRRERGPTTASRWLDVRGITLARALACSHNTAFARLTPSPVTAAGLRGCAARLGFGRQLPFDAAVGVSRADIDDDPRDLAEAAMGFGCVTISPLHAAAWFGAIADDGRRARPRLVSSGEVAGGGETRVLLAETARDLRQMLAETVHRGTARRAFRPLLGRLPAALAICGKTGSRTAWRGRPGISWFSAALIGAGPPLGLACLLLGDGLTRAPAAEVVARWMELCRPWTRDPGR
ncbi:MAG TPA: penicillin-binding transpeptidase domain-containing protein [Thermoanaerobaculia bacterium]|nr:penicillin-binding transpeptidase domain-containing protein [Thermoanaerobaculia bacterium]